MRNKPHVPQQTHADIKRNRYLKSLDPKTTIHFARVARTELLKSEARSLLPAIPKEDGYTFIPNSFIEKLLKEDLSVEQLNEVLAVFRQGR